MALPLPFCLFFISPSNFYKAAFLLSSVTTSCTMANFTTLPGPTPAGSKYLGISSKLQSISTKVAIDFSILPIVRVYSLPQLYLLFILLLSSTIPSFLIVWLMDGVFYYKKFQNRMKRSASSSKENIMKGRFSKKSSRQERPYEEQIKLICTQSVAPEYHRQSLPWQTPDFYKTFAHNQATEASRPESKQAFRKFVGRPETSKGVRPSEKSLKMWQQEAKIGYHSHYVVQRKECEQGESQPGVSNIEIIVTQSNRKEKKVAKSKFETDLDDEFLQLFAN